MNFDSYDIQVLVAVARDCRPNSPKPARAWTRVYPMPGVSAYGNTLSALQRRGLLHRKSHNRVKPSPAGYVVVSEWKAYRLEFKKRRILYDLIVFGPHINWIGLNDPA